MTKQPIRGPYFELWIQNSSGGYTVTAPIAERAYLGTVVGYPDASACGIIKDDGTFWGQVVFDRGGSLGILGTTVEYERSLRQPTTYSIPTTPTVGASPIGTPTMYAWDVAMDVASNEFVGQENSSVAQMLEKVEYSLVTQRSIWMQNALLRPYLSRTIFRGSASVDPHAVNPGLGTVRAEWEANQTSANRDLVILYGHNLGAVAYAGGISQSSTTYGYACVPVIEDWYAVQWHEAGHSWNLPHETADNPEGNTVLSRGEYSERGSYARFSGPEVKTILAKKAAELRAFVGQGIFTAVNLPPYAALDSVKFRQFVDTQVTIPVLKNDFDANDHTISLTSFDSTSAKGGTVTQTGSGASAQLVYIPPTGYVGTDWLNYVITDSSGQSSTGVVVIDLQPSDSLKAYWPMNEASGTIVANDTSFFDHDGTIVNGEIAGATGRFSNAFSFDGVDDRVEVSSLDVDSANVTIAGWIKRPTEAQTPWAGILYNRVNGAAAFNFGTANELRYHWNGTNYNWNSGLIPPANQWVFVALVVEPTKATIYMHDGTSLQSAVNTATHATMPLSGTSTIGSDGSGRYFKGLMDDIRLYSRSLSQTELLALAAGGSSETPAPVHQAANVKNGLLTWAPGAAATQSQVYVGTSSAAVAAADTSSVEYQGATTDAKWTYPVVANTTYYWRVDTITSTGTVTGAVWRFTTGSETFDPRLVALWRMNEGSGTKAVDALGRNDGSLWYGTTWSAGKSGSGVQFDGVDGYISTPKPLLDKVSKFTIAGWYKSPLTSGNSIGLWGQNDMVEFGINGTNIAVWTPGGGSITTPLPPANQWHHVACVGDGTNLKLYIDGMLVKTGGNATASYGTSDDYAFKIGGGGIWSSTGDCFTGQIDDVRVYRDALSASDVTALYAINHPPTLTATILSVAENTPTGTVIGTLNGQDSDVGDTLTYAIVSGNAGGLISINATTGAVSITRAPDYESQSAETATVRVTDQTGLMATTNLTVSITNVLNDDSDTDGLTDEWETANFGDTTSQNGIGDPDDDGFTNKLEEALGTYPSNSGSKPDPIYGGLKAWWRLNETTGTVAADTAGAAQDGTLINGPAWSSGVENGALTFDGSNDKVDLGYGPTLTGTTDFSASAWVKLIAGAGASAIISQREPGTNGYQGEYVLWTKTDGKVEFFVYNNSAHQFDITSSQAINDGKWHHVAAVRSGTNGYLYIDGVLAGQGSGTIRALANLKVYVGYDGRDNNKFLNGQLDDVRLYTRAVSAAEAGQMYSQYALPLPWANGTVGSGALAGTSQYANGKYTVSGSGVLGGTADQAHTVYQTLTGDGEIKAQVVSLQNTGTSSRIGVMIRDTLAANSRFVFMGMNNGNDYCWARKTSVGGSATTTASSTGTLPNTWLRLVRNGNTITSYKSANGIAWTSVGTVNVSLATNCYIGLAVASGSADVLNTSQFSNVQVTP